MLCPKFVVSVAAVGAVCLGLAACGGQAEPTEPLTKMLPMTGEIPGFSESSITIYSSARASVTDVESAHDLSSDPALLRADGFQQGISELIAQPSGQATGVAYVGAFRSPEGAVKYRNYLHQAVVGPDGNVGPPFGIKLVHFRVSGIPSALGIGITSQVGAGVTASVVWTEGDCMLSLADQSQSAPRPLTAVLITGAQAIDKRTHSHCSA